MLGRGEATREKILVAAEAIILRNGYGGATVDQVLAESGLTKGAFFHHFRSKADLARAVVERYWANDAELFLSWSARADRLAEDPLDRMLAFLKLFEEFLDSLGAPFPGCVFAAYTQESALFDHEIRDYIREKFEEWLGMFEAKLGALIAARKPTYPVTARALAEVLATIIEGGFIMAKAYGDKRWVQRQLAGYRAHLELLFRLQPHA